MQPFDVFPGHQKCNELDVYGYWEVGALLDGLARCERPAVAGLDEGLFSIEMHDDSSRFDRYKRSQLSLIRVRQGGAGRRPEFSPAQPD